MVEIVGVKILESKDIAITHHLLFKNWGSLEVEPFGRSLGQDDAIKVRPLDMLEPDGCRFAFRGGVRTASRK
jgi:hypothetical protein